MLFSSALERSNDPHIELIVQTFVSKSQIWILAMFIWLEGKFCKSAEARDKMYPWDESKMNVCERYRN